MQNSIKRMTREKDTLRVKMYGVPVKEFREILNILKITPGAIIDYGSGSNDWLVPYTEKNEEMLVFYGFPPIKKIVRKEGRPWRNIDLPAGFDFLRPYQRDGVRFAEWTNGRCLIGDDMGCVDGDAIISINRGGKASKVKLKDAYLRFNNLDKKNYNWSKNIKTNCRCLDEERNLFKLNEVLGIFHKGKKKVLSVSLESGKNIKLTEDHELLTPDNTWKPCGSLVTGDSILINGKNICKHCGGSENIITYKYSKFLGYCKKCMYTHFRKNCEYSDQIKRRKGKDGYIYLTGKPTEHHHRKSSSGVLEHIVIMEEYLGRKIVFGEEEVHHINGIRDDNRIENLQVLSISDHKKTHEIYSHFGNYIHKSGKKIITIPKIDKIVSIEYLNTEIDVYDIAMKEPNHNFIANGVVVHNCGKTVQALAYLKMHSDKLPVLIVVKASTKLQWEQEIYRFHPGQSVTVLNGKTPYPIDGDKIYVINWDILTYWKDELKKHNWKVTIADEIQVLAKGQSVKRVKAFANLVKKIPHIIALSGTPIKAYLWQFYTILHILDSKSFPDRTSFYIRYCGMSPVDSEPPLDKINNLDELQALLKNVMIRRTKGKVLKELPEKVRTVIPLYIENIKKYKEAEEALLPNIHKASKKTFDHLKWSAFEVKKEAAVKWIQDFLTSTDEKICVFGYHREVLEFLYDKFKTQSVLYYGGVTQSKKNKMIKQFQNDKNCRLFFGNILSAGVGVDGLQKVCSTMIIIEFSWSPADHDQVEDRLHRFGQASQTMIYYLVAPQTVESHIMYLLDEKRKIVKTILDGEKPGENELLQGLIRRYQHIEKTRD